MVTIQLVAKHKLDFLQNAEGKLDPSGSLGDHLSQLKIKYAAEESRYSYVVAIIPTVELDGVSVDVETWSWTIKESG